MRGEGVALCCENSLPTSFFCPATAEANDLQTTCDRCLPGTSRPGGRSLFARTSVLAFHPYARKKRKGVVHGKNCVASHPCAQIKREDQVPGFVRSSITSFARATNSGLGFDQG